ncbi:hypothetical protein TA3x_005044 [Tundrisphaera sp. TA3]|uniref:hypothetical protein n=1 Tax=Tundrisphaera sp. TA3 TaxID=3435775 RepID=UPI003EBE57EC
MQLIALRAWKLEHGGAEAESLDVLVPSLLDRLPADPYSTTNQPFLYVKTAGRKVLPPRLHGGIANEQTGVVEAGRRLLISVGPNHSYDGEVDQVWRSSPPMPPDDLVFPVP